jgi:hypothetical protein
MVRICPEQNGNSLIVQEGLRANRGRVSYTLRGNLTSDVAGHFFVAGHIDLLDVKKTVHAQYSRPWLYRWTSQAFADTVKPVSTRPQKPPD